MQIPPESKAQKMQNAKNDPIPCLGIVNIGPRGGEEIIYEIAFGSSPPRNSRLRAETTQAQKIRERRENLS